MPRPIQEEVDVAVDFRSSGLPKEFLRLVADRQAASAREKAAKATKDDLTKDILALLSENDVKTVLIPDFRVTFTPGSNTSISKQRLLGLGVKAAVIAKATKTTTYETVTVTALKGGE